MVIRGRVTGRVSVQAPLRRRPDWDNNIHDLKTLKLTPSELEAKLKSFKSKEWSRPKRAPIWSSQRAPDPKLVVKDAAPSQCSRENEANVHVEPSMTGMSSHKETFAVKQSFICMSDEEDDFDENIRRLESLQNQQQFPALLQSTNNGLGCSQQFMSGSPKLLEYLETEMHKAWSEMSITKEKKVAKSWRPMRRRIKLQLVGRKKTSAHELKMLDVILAKQQSSALTMNQTFVQELHKHVSYQQHVIHELNEFRISATRELTTLVALVQKLLFVQEAKASSQPQPPEGYGHAQEVAVKTVAAKVTELSNNTTTETVPLTITASATTPPKPRQVPIFLKKNTSTVRLGGFQAPALPEIKKPFAQEAPKEETTNQNGDLVTEEHRRHPLSTYTSRTLGEFVRGSHVNVKKVHGEEDARTLKEGGGRRLPPSQCHVSKPAEEMQKPATPEEPEGREHERLTEHVKRRFPSTSTNVTKPPKDELVKEAAPVQLSRNEHARITENKRRFPSSNVAKPVEEQSKEGQVSSDEFDRRENPLFESDVHGKSIALPRGPFKKSRLQDQGASPRWRINRPVRALDRQGSEQVVPVAFPEAQARKPSLDQDRFVTVSRKQHQQQQQQQKQEGPSKVNDTRTQDQRGDGRRIGPRYRLQGWSAAFLQTERMRGKENNLQRRKF